MSKRQLVGVGFIALLACFGAVGFSAAQSNSRSPVHIQVHAVGRLITDFTQVGDEQKVPALDVNGEIWSLEFRTVEQYGADIEGRVPALSGKLVEVLGTPRVECSNVAGVQRYIVVDLIEAFE